MGDVQWWCSARGTAWQWDWQAYPGVWLTVVAVAAWVRMRFRSGQLDRARRASLVVGLVALWLTLDWPVGALGTGYLASVHAVQFIVLTMVVSPLLLAGVAIASDKIDCKRSTAIAKAITHPVITAAAFTIVMAVTHAPLVVDGLMRYQLGAFALDVVWLGAGLLFWWPIAVRVPHRPWFVPPLRMLYMFLGTQAHLVVAMWLIIAAYPVYAIYELAPRALPLSALADQQLAGAIMIGVAGPLMLVAMSIVFFRWANVPSPG